MIKFLAFVGKIIAAMVGVRLGSPGLIASVLLFLWAASDVIQFMAFLAG